MTIWVFRLARASAIVGGLALCAITLMSVVSITGRALLDIGLGPVPGDFELVELSTGIAIFLFLPWTYVRAGHASVDLLYRHLPVLVQRGIRLASDLLMLTLWVLLSWRLWDGMLEKRAYFETTFILQLPLWWAYAAACVGAVIGCVTYFAQTAITLGWARPPDGWLVASAGGH